MCRLRGTFADSGHWSAPAGGCTLCTSSAPLVASLQRGPASGRAAGSRAPPGRTPLRGGGPGLRLASLHASGRSPRGLRPLVAGLAPLPLLSTDWGRGAGARAPTPSPHPAELNASAWAAPPRPLGRGFAPPLAADPPRQIHIFTFFLSGSPRPGAGVPPPAPLPCHKKTTGRLQERRSIPGRSSCVVQVMSSCRARVDP